MADRTGDLAKALVENYDGRAERVWETAKDGAELFANLTSLPGFGDQKAKIFIALLAKRVGVQPSGWEKAAGSYAEHGCYSVADGGRVNELAGHSTVERSWAPVARRIRDDATNDWHDDDAARRFKSVGGRLVRGAGTLDGPKRVVVEDEAIDVSRAVVIATGT